MSLVDCTLCNAGAFVRTMGEAVLTDASDLQYCANGCVAVADLSSSRVCIFAGEGSPVTHQCGGKAAAGDSSTSSAGVGVPAHALQPYALAFAQGLLYVLDWGSARVLVYS